MEQKRITSFDTFRAIAAFMIVFLHYPLKFGWENEINTICRVAVPFFFLVSGYFNYAEELRSEKVAKQIKKLIVIVVTVNMWYLAFRIIVKTYKRLQYGMSVTRGLRKIFLELTTKRFLLLNFGMAGHLWYIRAMIVVLLCLIIMKKCKVEKLVKWSIPIVIICDLCLCKYSMILFGEHFPRKYFEPLTKFIGVGYVYFFTGYFYRQMELEHKLEKLREFFTRYKVFLAVMILLSLALNIVEFHWLENIKMNVEPCNFISTFLLSMSIFIYLAFNKTLGCNLILHNIGKKYAEYIYFYHVLAGKLFGLIFRGTVVYPFYYTFRTFIIYFTVLLIFYLISRRKEKRKTLSGTVAVADRG